MSDYQIAVLDIGKTNKKLFVYDSNLKCLNPDEKGVVIPEVTIEGVLCDDMAGIYRWMLGALAEAAGRFRQIRCVSISTHGATIALLGDDGDKYFPGDGGLAFPIVSYMQPITREEDAAFYDEVGYPEVLQLQTGTAPFGYLINHGKQIHWLKKRFPERFAGVTNILMYPQYVSYLLTGHKDAIEPTYIGCHGYLLDTDGKHYSDVAYHLIISHLLPELPFVSSWHVMGTLRLDLARETGLSPDVVVTVGVHDSNAALVPHFVLSGRTWIVQDTGTWVVTMTPANDNGLKRTAEGRSIFLNRSVYGTPVMTTIFRGGAEFDYYRKSVFPQFPRPAGINKSVLRDVLTRREGFILPTVERGSGLYPDSAARIEGVGSVFRDAETAWCVFDLGLAIQGYAGINIATQAPRPVILQGQIATENPLYAPMLSALYEGDREVFIGHGGGAPYGAAVLGAAAVEGKKPEALGSRIRLDLRPVAKLDVDRKLLMGYVDRFFELLLRPSHERGRRRQSRR